MKKYFLFFISITVFAFSSFYFSAFAVEKVVSVNSLINSLNQSKYISADIKGHYQIIRDKKT